MSRIIREVKPRWVLAENVTGLLSISDGRVFGEVVRDLAACGYVVEWDCIPASTLGAPHRRDRVWVVGSLEESRDIKGGDDQPRIFRENISRRLDAEKWTEKTTSASRSSAKRKTLAHAESERLQGSGAERLKKGPSELQSGRHGGAREICNPAGERLPNWAGGKVGQPSPLTEFERSNGKELSNPNKTGFQKARSKLKAARTKHGFREREIERDFRGVAHGVANRVDRIKLLGNGQVVQVVEWIGKRIMEFEANK
jgi:DNA (cytosine-5)-methyltransferase 1